MIIKIKDYELVQDEDRFNIVKHGTRKKEDGSTAEYSKTLGYGFRLKTAIKRIILDNLQDKDIKVTLKKFLVEYKKIQDELFKPIDI